MKIGLTFLILFGWPLVGWSQDLYVARRMAFSFFSEAPMEDISAKTDKGVSALNVSSRAIYFKVPIRSFEFRKSLMKQHFNENYLESEKYPVAEFKGNVLENIDPKKDGTFPVTVQGKLNIHGVIKDYSVRGELQVSNGSIAANAKFPVKLEDHRIKIPSLVIRNIAEIVDVQVSAVYGPSAQTK
ncbi:MAG: YceI family protein [Arcticibacter sp.]